MADVLTPEQVAEDVAEWIDGASVTISIMAKARLRAHDAALRKRVRRLTAALREIETVGGEDSSYTYVQVKRIVRAALAEMGESDGESSTPLTHEKLSGCRE